MGQIIIHSEILNNTKINLDEIKELCPFGAIEIINDTPEINDACKMCKLCVKNAPSGLFEYKKHQKPAINKDDWQGICVYIEHREGEIHPVSLELIGKAKELAQKINQQVYALVMGNNIAKQAENLLFYGVNKVFLYDNEKLEYFTIEPYTAVFEDFINKVKPNVILVGATVIGRSLAPRVAARVRTGLTADCTKLDIKPNTDLVQIRPAFGGNIMAQIVTPNNRPQLATVRYKIFDAPEKEEQKSGTIELCSIDEKLLSSRIKVLSVKKKEKQPDISDAQVIVAMGRGFKSQKDIELIERLANKLNAQIAVTRPVIEAGWADATKQIGLSGRTVKPKLIITVGISGSVQFKAGMQNSEIIISINNEETSPIFDVAHYGVVGDLYEILPKLLEKLER